MMKLLFTLCVFLTATIGFGQDARNTEEKDAIAVVLDRWHKAAATANYEEYFDQMTPDAVFIGTDATENWTLEEFKAYSKPHFEKGKAWNFHVLERNIFGNDVEKMAWFDELLDTQMGLCRGSGVLSKSNDTWKIRHYVLSIAVPNEKVPEVIKLKKEFDRKLTAKLKNH